MANFSIYENGVSYLSEPEEVDILKGLFFGDVVDDDDGVRSFVVSSGNGPEPLLACSVPNLKLDHVSLHSDGPTHERQFT